MRIKFENFFLNVQHDERINNPDLIPIFFLHGFTVSANDWDNILKKIPNNFAPAAIDLIGHGKSDSPASLYYYSSESITQQIFHLINHFNLDKIVLAGYSMGGRAALSFAVKYPDKIQGLILESVTAGIENEEERNERIKKDENLADYILSHSIDEFIDHWMSLEIFNTQKRFSNEKLEKIKTAKLLNNIIGLSNSLKGFGTGKMKPLHQQLQTISAKALLITGELDTKFTAINSGMVKLFPNAKHEIIKNAGHNTHLEEPERFIGILNDFLKNL
jgi:2-succinyl-6-hydroxy-2,4-cyclohexadiene-1-carboxylate synthase